MELCYIVVIVGMPLAVAGLVTFMKKRKISAMMKERKQGYIELAESWKDSDVVEFNPTDLITEEVFLDMIDRLRKRVINNNLEDPDSSPYGVPVSYVNMVANHLTDFYEIADVNSVLDQFKHFKTVIGDINLHFIHMVGSEEKKSTPILLLHGWPSTVWEFHKSIPMLVEQGYTVVIPSLPGLGFTEPPNVTGVSPAVMACAYRKLMLQLGYKRFVIHGGDWGSIIGSLMTYMYPESIIGLHNTMNQVKFGWRQILQTLVGAVFPSLVYTTAKEKGFMHPVSKFGQRLYQKFAYFHVQSVLPDSYGYGMVDSPVGLIGWIGSCYAMASSSKDTTKSAMANIEDGIKCFGLDNICAMISIFWSVKSAQASMRIYHEFYSNDTELLSSLCIPNVPVAISNFPNEGIHLTRFATGAIFNNIKQYNYHTHGGHFSHIDNTKAVVGDLTSFIQKIK